MSMFIDSIMESINEALENCESSEEARDVRDEIIHRLRLEDLPPATEGSGKRIDQMFAFVVIDEDGDEGIPAIQVGSMAYPLVGADMARVDALRPHAENLSKALGQKVTLKHFTTVTDLEVIGEDLDPHN